MKKNPLRKNVQKRKVEDSSENEDSPLAKQFRLMTTESTTTAQNNDEKLNPMDKEGNSQKIMLPNKEDYNRYLLFRQNEAPGGSISESPEKFFENEKGGRETLLSDESMDCSSIPSSPLSLNLRHTDYSQNSNILSCDETILSDDEEPPSLRGSFIFDSVDFQSAKLSPFVQTTQIQKKNNSFLDLPDEIILCIFQKLPYTWKQLLGLRRVCKEWARLLADSSLKYGRFSEDLEVMMQNERKHFLPITDYLSSPGMQDINGQMRSILVGWLAEVTQEFNLDTETLFISVHLLDRFLSLPNRHITRGKLQLLGVTTLLVAAKHEEIYPPTVSDLEYISDNAYTKEEIKGMEINLLNALKFDITVCTSRRFLHYYLKAMDKFLRRKVEEGTIVKMGHFADYILESTLIPYEFVLCAPSFISVVVIYLVFYNFELSWCAELESETHHSLHEITPFIQQLHHHIKSVSSDNQNMIRNKYSQSKFDFAAKIPIRDLPNLDLITSNNNNNLI